MKGTRRWSAPAEVRASIGLLLGIPLVYLGLVLVMVGYMDARAGTAAMPLTSLLFGALVTAGLLLRMPSARACGYVVVGVFALMHVFSLLSAQLWWVNVFSGLAGAGYIYAGILLSSGPLVRFLEGASG